MKSANGLYPIIRRVRRPLLPVDPLADAKPVPTGPANEAKPTEPAKSEEKKNDAGDSNK